jgi:Cu(I)/Ag(I) efflux system protein CusF
MKTLILTLSMMLASTAVVAQAATPEHDMSQHQMATPTAARHTGVGVLKAVNAKDGKVQIAHETIADLGWPPMTMWFEMKTSLPEGLKVGDTVSFELEQFHSKSWVITRIERKR